MTQHPLADALRWYARENSWRSCGMHMSGRPQLSAAEIDRGERAREALAQYEKSDTDEKAIRLDERKKIIAGGCHHTRAASERVETRPDLEAWQTSQSEWFDATILEIVSEYAEWRDKQQSDTDRDQLREAVAVAISNRAAEMDEMASYWWGEQNGQPANTIRLSEHQKDRFRTLADAAIAALASKTAIDPATVERVTKAILFEDCGSTEGWEENTNLGEAAILALGKDQ